MKKLVLALLTSVFFLFAAASTAEAKLLCTPQLYTLNPAWTANNNNDQKYLPVSGTSFPSNVGSIYVSYGVADGENLSTICKPGVSCDVGIHWCWRNTEGLGIGANTCASGSIGSTYITEGSLDVYNNRLFGKFDPFTGAGQENNQWEVVPWRNAGGFGFGEADNGCPSTVITATAPTAEYSCNNPGVDVSYSTLDGKTQINIGMSVNGANMDPQKTYRTMIKHEGTDFGSGWNIDLIKRGNAYVGGSSFGQTESLMGDGKYTVVVADAANIGCNVITDNFDIRNCQAFPQCIATMTIDSSDPTKFVDYDDREKVVDSAENNRVNPDQITPFSFCRQISVLTDKEIAAQVAQVKDPKRAAALQKELVERSATQREEKSQCCQCMLGTRFFDGNNGACQGELGTTGNARVRTGFQPGIYTAVGCIGSDSESIVTRLVRIGLGIAGGVALLMILAGAFMFSTSQGEPKRAGEAKELITSAVLGLIFIIFSVTLLQFIGVNLLHIPGFGTTDTTGTAVNANQ